MTRTVGGSNLDLRDEVNLLLEMFEAADLKEGLLIVTVVDDIIMLVDAIIDNVLSNAISFSPKCGIVQFILTADATSKSAVLETLDDGPGIPDAKLETVFDRFYTERPSSEGFGEHSGLGLSIAQQIADAHNGLLTAENRPEGGACFRLVLPLES